MIVSLVNQKGGTGKSTLAVSIASQWMSKQKRVLLVDADPQQTARTACANARENGLLAPDVIVGTTNLHKEIEKALEFFDHIVIDTPGRLSELQRAALLVSDVALVPISTTQADVAALGATVDSIAQVQPKNERLRSAILQSKLMKNTVIGRRGHEVLRDAGLPIFKASTHQLVAWAETLDRGQGVAQYEPNGPAADELRAVVKELERFYEGGKRA